MVIVQISSVTGFEYLRIQRAFADNTYMQAAFVDLPRTYVYVNGKLLFAFANHGAISLQRETAGRTSREQNGQ